MPAGIENFHDLLQSVSLTSLGVTRVVSSNFEWKFEIDLPGIWDVTVTTKADTLFGVGTGTGVLRLDEPGKHDEEIIIVR